MRQVKVLPESEMVELAYLGTNGGAIRYAGYLNRSYRVSRGCTVKVHPDDVKRLLRTRKFKVVKTASKPVPQVEETPLAEAVTEYNITDGAKALADENGIDLSTVAGSGRDGKIVKRDITALL